MQDIASYVSALGLLFVVNIAKNIAVMLAVFFDCKSTGVKNKGGWMALTFFFPVAAIVYVCIRDTSVKKEVPKYCYTCGATCAPNTIACHRCRSTALRNFNIVNSKQYRNSAKVCLVIAIICVIMYFGCFVRLANASEKILNDFDSNGNYSEFFGDNDDSEDFFNFGNDQSDDSSDNSTDNSNEDDFKNFGNNK